jgi:hypothetical protein
MSMKITIFAAALVGAALLAGSPSFAQQQPSGQQPPTPQAAQATLDAVVAAAPVLPTLGVTKTYSAVVLADGTLALGPFGASSFNFGIPGDYQVTFPSDVSKCVYTATIGDTPAGFPGPGIVVVTPRSGNANGIFVRTFNVSGTPVNMPFHIQVQC